ncbi:MAG: type II toxin-antitoxin system PemK/MazF family toxin [Nocardioidaceae bacterium]
MTTTPLRWAVVVVGLDPAKGHEQAGKRRVLVVSYEPFHRSGLMTVCPITAARAEPRYPAEVAIPAGEAGQTKPGVIMCSQIRTVSQQRIRGQPLGIVSPQTRRQVRRAIAHHLGLDIPAVVDA